MATALTTYSQENHDALVLLRQNHQSNFSSAVEALNLAQANYDALVKTNAIVETDIATKRSELSANTNLPSDIETLAEELRQLLITRRHNTAALANATQTIKFEQIKVSALEQSLQQLTQKVNTAAIDLMDVKRREVQHSIWVATETEEAVAVVRDLASNLLAGNTITVAEGEDNPGEILAAARTRIESDIPELLLTLARARADSVSTHLANFQDQTVAFNNLLINHNNANSTISGVVAQRWSEYLLAEQSLKDYALTSVGQYQYVIELLKSVTSSNSLTLAEQTRIADISLDASALATETALNSARLAVENKNFEIELALTNAVIADVNDNPNDDADVQARTAEFEVLTGELAAAQAAHTEAMATAIDLWEVAIPDSIWSNVQTFDTAISKLTAIRDSNLTTLTDAFNDAETALVLALTNDNDHSKLTDYLTDRVLKSTEQEAYFESIHGSLSLSVLRGDY